MRYQKVILIVGFLMSLSLLTVESNGQPEPQNLVEIEVKKFMDTFYQILRKTNDLKRVPKSFFTNSFERNLVTSTYSPIKYDAGCDDLRYSKISISNQSRYAITQLNSFYLQFLWDSGFPDESGSSDKRKNILRIRLGDRVFSRIEKLQKKFITFDGGCERSKTPLGFTNVEAISNKSLHNANKTLTKINSIWKKAIETASKDPKWRNLELKVKKEVGSSRFEIGLAKDSFGYTDESNIFLYSEYPFDFTIVREKGTLKIIFLTLFDSDY